MTFLLMIAGLLLGMAIGSGEALLYCASAMIYLLWLLLRMDE